MDDGAARTDAVLVRQALAGDRQAFGALVERHQAAAIRLAVVIGGSVADAPDIAQEAFVKAHAALSRQRDPDLVRSWLLRIVANEAKNFRRASARRERRDDRYAVSAGNTPLDPAAAAEMTTESEALLAAVRRLSDRDRQVIGYRYFCGLSEAETAAALHTATGTVKSRTARALERLRRELGGVS
jgi:RNA polymerase sigma-70 factor (ECF subfamily)